MSEEAYSNWKKHYANKGFVSKRRFRNPITPFKEMIEQRGWEAFCAHQKLGYKAVVKECYSNLVGRKDNTVFVRGVWVPYGAKAINEVYGMAGTSMGLSSKSSWKTQILRRFPKSSLTEKHKWDKGKENQKP